MATAEQIANKAQNVAVEAIDEELKKINRILKKYDPLFVQRDRLQAARRALLSERSTTAGGGRGLTQDEVANAMNGNGSLSVHEIAEKLGDSSTSGLAKVRGHLNRGKDERFVKHGDNTWSLRNPEEDEDEDDEGDED